MISYGQTPNQQRPAILVDGKIVAWVTWGGDPMRFQVWDESVGAVSWSETFETLAGADRHMWTIAKWDEARADNALRRARAH